MIANIIITNPRARGKSITIEALLASITSFIIMLEPITVIWVDSSFAFLTISAILLSDLESSDPSVVIPAPINPPPALPVGAFRPTIIIVAFASILPFAGSKSFVSIMENMPWIIGGVWFEPNIALIDCLTCASSIFWIAETFWSIVGIVMSCSTNTICAIISATEFTLSDGISGFFNIGLISGLLMISFSIWSISIRASEVSKSPFFDLTSIDTLCVSAVEYRSEISLDAFATSFSGINDSSENCCSMPNICMQPTAIRVIITTSAIVVFGYLETNFPNLSIWIRSFLMLFFRFSTTFQFLSRIS